MRWASVLLLAMTLAAADWPASRVIGEHQVPLCGSARFTWWGIEVYDVALYLPPGAAPLAEAPRAIAFRYRRAFTARDLARATTVTVQARAAGAPPAEVEAGLAAINRLWPDVGAGDELTLVYEPAQGLRVLLNDRQLGVVSGTQFARVLFSVWLGEQPIDRRLRDRLLARR
ncbi:MAG: chalcone isomerase family protein [Planctomycetota bacterium]|nr:chalcone isomerase family protein [Planctomycetota bacterium]MDW8373508.1 chalcone isomerase family protein [Planctomycetota bacterium]